MITMDDIVREGNPILTQVATKVELPPTSEEIDTLKEMLMYLKNSQDPEIAEQYELRPGVGLAAPQIGISKRMIAVHFDDLDEKISHGLFNPRIVSHSVEKAYLTSGEGCLSVDREVPGYVPRYARITVKGTNIEGEELKLRLKGYASIVIQHEIDHLNGIMFYDHINPDNPFEKPENAIALD
ncbi:peptide deformylase [Aquibacillus sp. 3ASR75-11]|uniref:Peptide deformylase n=1 Tax=Terrihalobacillus insolitus TaxID=2950438 RepID=A0A9X3WPY2_9BACI|nr:peptide deformylase [Terrihalobacillus insolitus]MDC3412771.1 peptide deformylase [Terrihalobacillus insolitus]MDC3423752.1 peptide deformylase [Terrihalobacillus insolitus]